MKESTMGEAVEAVARAIADVKGGINYDYMDFCRDAAQAALAAVRPFHMEEAAGIAEDCDPLGHDAYTMQEAIRQAIRAAKTDGGGA